MPPSSASILYLVSLVSINPSITHTPRCHLPPPVFFSFGFQVSMKLSIAHTPRWHLPLQVETIDYRECQLYWAKYGRITDHHICTRPSKKRSGGICGGDSGGPLSCIAPGGAFFVAGVASYVQPPCNQQENYPDAFVSTLYFKQWIKESIIKHDGQLPPILDAIP
ncbi:chymotrypsin-like elastase family member 3b [Plakobranchus ocellatus]|uniref:Chymotrypsin-like elastase family member 3b n=1 Tax=Plakobranchus ocellatus TaxID=259542 RepID=A0AAV4D3M2_9GAST|nr:chymotrypsin-like elastase family member 3b [Plakobranchus ocellatus]